MNRIFEIGGERHEISPYGNSELLPMDDGPSWLLHGGSSHRIWMARDGDRIFVRLNGRTFEIEEIDPRSTAKDGAAADDTAKAPMPGTVISVEVKAGQTVRDGEVLMTIESMKLQTQITAWRDGEVEAVHLAPGDEFDRGAPLVGLKGEDA